MDKISTLNELATFTQNETKYLKELGLIPQQNNKPKDSTIHFILNFSKAYSVRKSKKIGKIENLMN